MIKKESTSSNYFPALDGLRGIMAIGVVLAHIHMAWFPGALIMMEIFLSISGFLITGIILRSIKKHGKIDLFSFWKRRLRRLWPALFVVVLSTLCVAWWVRDEISFDYAVSDAIASIFYYSNFPKLYDFVYPGMYGQTWSLSVEEQFYILWPILISIAFALGLRHFQFMTLLLTVALASMLWKYYLIYDGVPWSRLYYALETRMDAFVFGGILAANFDWFRELAKGKYWHQFLNLCVLGLTAVIVTGSPYDIDYFKWRQTAAILLATATILLLTSHRDGIFKRLACWPGFMFLGRRSYSIYLWHWPIIWLLLQTTELRQLQLALVVLPLTLLLSSLTYSFVETRFLSATRKKQLEPEPPMQSA